MRKLIVVLIALMTSGCVVSVGPDLNVMRLPPTPTMTMTAGSTSTAPVQVKTPAGWTSCVVTGELHIRTHPAADAEVLGYLQGGDKVVASTSKNGEWRQVQFGQVRGWSHSNWLNCGMP